MYISYSTIRNARKPMEENRQTQNRYVEMLRAAAPYASRNARNSLDIALQIQNIAGRLSGTNSDLSAASLGDSPDMEACDLDGEQGGDLEAMLLQIQEHCSPREQNTIGMMLNFTRAGKLFRGYQGFMRDQNMQTADMSAQDTSTSSNNPGSNMNNQGNTIMNFLLSQLSPEQKSTLEVMKMLMDN